jgi:ABC-2 type transport system ATP-binding protein
MNTLHADPLLERPARPLEDAQSPSALLSVQGLSKSYGSRQALAPLSFDMQAGQCLALVGVNGAGKSTLIKLLLGLTPASSGQAWLQGCAVGDARARERLCYLPERFQPPQWMRVRDYLLWATTMQAQASTPDDWVNELSQLGMDASVLDLPIAACSKGMTQKIGLTVVLQSNRPLIVLDEPMSGLDPISRAQIRERLHQRLQRGQAVLMCTHALGDVDALAHQVLVLHTGSLRFMGSPSDWTHQTRTRNLDDAFLTTVGVTAHEST